MPSTLNHHLPESPEGREMGGINPRVSVIVYQHLRKCEKEVQLYLLDGADHGGSEFWSEEILAIVEKFFNRNCQI